MNTPDPFLTQLEPLTDRERLRHAIALGRRARTEPEAAALLLEWSRGGFFARRLALLASHGSREAGPVLTALREDPQAALRRLAGRLAALFVPEDEILGLVGRLHPATEHHLLRELHERRRTSVVDAYLIALSSALPGRVPYLIAYASEGWLEARRTEVVQRAAWAGIRRLVTTHPRLATRIMTDLLELYEYSPVVGYALRGFLRPLAERCPLEAIRFHQAMQQCGLPDHDRQQILLAITPWSLNKELADIGLSEAWAIRRRLRRLEPAALATLPHRLYFLQCEVGTWFPRLPAGHREPTYRLLLQQQAPQTPVPAVVIQSLPEPLRAAEARRHLELEAVSGSAEDRLPYVACLPWDEARSELLQALESRLSSIRWAAFQALGVAVLRVPAGLELLLELAVERPRDADAVRKEILRALAAQPSGRWREGHLPWLDQVLEAAGAAADLSAESAVSAEKLFLQLLPAFPEWSAGWLDRWLLVRRRLDFSPLARRTESWDSARVDLALAAVAEKWVTATAEGEPLQEIPPPVDPKLPLWRRNARRDPDPDPVCWGSPATVTALAEALGTHLRAMPAMQGCLANALQHTRSLSAAETGLRLLARAAPGRFFALAEQLRVADPAWLTLPTLQKYFHRRHPAAFRQADGTHCLDPRRTPGSSSPTSALTHPVPFHRLAGSPVLERGFHRWSPSDQVAVAELLCHTTRLDATPEFGLRTCFERLGRMPDLPMEILTAAGETPSARRRDLARRALARRGGAAVVERLCAELAATPEASQVELLEMALGPMPPATQWEALQHLPVHPIGVGKRVIRLVGRHEGPAAWARLLEWSRRDLPRDLRAALLHACWNHAERREAQVMLERGAADPNPEVALAAFRVWGGPLTPTLASWLADLYLAQLEHPDLDLRRKAARRLDSLSVPDMEGSLLRALLQNLELEARVSHSWLESALRRTLSVRNVHILTEQIQTWSRTPGELRSLIYRLELDSSRPAPVVRAAGRAVHAGLAALPHAAVLEMGVITKLLRPAERLAALEAAAGAGRLHGEALWAAVHGVRRPSPSGEELEAFDRLERALARHPDERFRRLGLAHLAALGTQAHWEAEQLRRLREYETDPSPLVADAAWVIQGDREL